MAFENFELNEPLVKGTPEARKRGEQLRNFWALAKVGNFEQYPRLKIAYGELRNTLIDLGCDESEIQSVFEKFLIEPENNGVQGETISETANLIKKTITELVRRKIEGSQSDDHIRLASLEQAMEKFYIRSLEILGSFQKQERKHLASHRAGSTKNKSGFEFNGPELSFDAITTALQKGVRTIELDIVALADGTPVVSHSLKTKTNEGKKKFSELENIGEANEKKATVGKTGAQVYTLEALLERLVPYKGLARLNIEIKDKATIPELVKLLKEYKLEEDVIISSFNPKTLLDIHAELPKTKIGFNTLITELNANTILANEPKKTKPFVLPLIKVALGGTELPSDPDISIAHFRTLPPQVLKMLIETKGFLTIQLEGTRTKYAPEVFEKVAKEAHEKGLNLAMFRVPSEHEAFLKKEIDLLYLDQGEKVTHQRLGR